MGNIDGDFRALVIACILFGILIALGLPWIWAWILAVLALLWLVL